MPRNDYECVRCHIVRADVLVGEGLPKPTCCDELMQWLPRGSHVDGFTPFDVDINGERVTVSTLRQVRQIEEQTARDYEAGRGAPVRFRAFSQDESNKDVNTFGRPEVPKFSTRNSRGEPLIVRRRAFGG